MGLVQSRPLGAHGSPVGEVDGVLGTLSQNCDPQPLVDAQRDGSLVLFVGAGASKVLRTAAALW